MNKNFQFPATPRVLSQPSSDFNQSRSGLRTLALFQDIDLSVARTKSGTGANAPIILNVAGNSFYADADPAYGNFRVVFQDTNFDNAPAPLYVAPGAIFNLPFTQILIYNTAQVGKIARFVYGVDIDFQPGSVSQVSFAGNVNLNGAIYNSSYVDNANFPVGPKQIIAPASNTTGIILSNFYASNSASAAGQFSVLAKSSAPAAFNDGDAVGLGKQITTTGGNIFTFDLINPLFVPAGKGVYIYTVAGTVPSQSGVAANWQQ